MAQEQSCNQRPPSFWSHTICIYSLREKPRWLALGYYSPLAWRWMAQAMCISPRQQQQRDRAMGGGPIGPVTTRVGSRLNFPYGVAVDGAGDVYIADSGNNTIKRWAPPNRTVATLVGSRLNHAPVA